MRHIAFMLAAALLAGCQAGERLSALKPPPVPTVVFISDFGLKDDSVAVCKAVMFAVEPRLRIVDLTHDVTPYDIEGAGRLIASSAGYFPPGTVFTAVIDPGVGSRRRAVALRTKKGRFYVGPDNGLFTRVLMEEGLQEARALENPAYYIQGASISSTFHGRDIFSPVSAHLARGEPLAALGPVAAELIRLPYQPAAKDSGRLKGQVEFIEEPYGNIITNIPAALLAEAMMQKGEDLLVKIGDKKFDLPYLTTFSDVGVGRPLAVISSRGYLCLAVNQGHFGRRYQIAPGAPVEIAKKAR
ncbi:MAG: SAM-dependent chlorinase/fluorinase [Elusimicrobia bacterium]|nr:SAM-dependent chlorinase/fluorinase [Elusimicrobiota bacterium]